LFFFFFNLLFPYPYLGRSSSPFVLRVYSRCAGLTGLFSPPLRSIKRSYYNCSLPPTGVSPALPYAVVLSARSGTCCSYGETVPALYQPIWPLLAFLVCHSLFPFVSARTSPEPPLLEFSFSGLFVTHRIPFARPRSATVLLLSLFLPPPFFFCLPMSRSLFFPGRFGTVDFLQLLNSGWHLFSRGRSGEPFRRHPGGSPRLFFLVLPVCGPQAFFLARTSCPRFLATFTLRVRLVWI